MSLFVCPVCREKLTLEKNSLKCPLGHSFDRSAAGDVYLLRSNGGEHGDSREMVRARRDFLDRGYYAPLMRELCRLALEYTEKDVNYFDAGCGTGYYTAGVIEALSEKGKVSAAGVDISKDAVKICAKRIKSAEFATASLYDLPFADETFDLVTNVFSPMAEDELARVTKKGGVMLYVVPAAKHLFEMKSVLYENPYENEEKTEEYNGFSHIGAFLVNSRCTLNREELSSLFAMTPYFWRTPEEGAKKLLSRDSLDVGFSFFIHAYRRV